MMLSAVMMLRYIGEPDRAEILEKAIAENIAEGKYVTYDLKENRDDLSAVGTSGFADAVVNKIKKMS
jgi:isocitrate dehydrogenase (NAD+)